MTVAEGCTNIEQAKTFIYRLNFCCLADTIEQADACFAREARLTYDKKYLATSCSLISVEVLPAPKAAPDQ